MCTYERRRIDETGRDDIRVQFLLLPAGQQGAAADTTERQRPRAAADATERQRLRATADATERQRSGPADAGPVHGCGHGARGR